MSMMRLKESKTIIVMVETRPVVLRLPHQKGVCRKLVLKNLRLPMALSYYTTNSFAKEECGW
jgi:hypothetical protein